MNHFTPGSPVEIVETEYPVMVQRYDIWRDSAGPGRSRGGIGLGSIIDGSSFSGLLTRVEIGHIRIRPSWKGRIRSRASGSSPSHRA
jgi:N-methylhydantoinase B/oxoprolinase/acetone carboxylase alpha subunit